MVAVVDVVVVTCSGTVVVVLVVVVVVTDSSSSSSSNRRRRKRRRRRRRRNGRRREKSSRSSIRSSSLNDCILLSCHALSYIGTQSRRHSVTEASSQSHVQVLRQAVKHHTGSQSHIRQSSLLESDNLAKL